MFFDTFRFLLIFGACLLSLVGKGIALASPFAAPWGPDDEKNVLDEQKLPVMATILATMFLPGFILGIASCWHNKNNNSNMLKTFVAHPSVVLMPTFTHFTFTSNEKLCRGRREKGEQEKEKGDSVDPFITFSPRLTIMNVILSIVCNVAYCIIMTQISTTRSNEYLFLRLYLYNIPHTIIYPFIKVIILGSLLTLFSIPFISKSSGNCSHICSVILTHLTLLHRLTFVLIFVFTIGPYIPWHLQIFLIPVSILGLVFTLPLLTNYSKSILPTCAFPCNLPACFSLPGVEYGALVCSDPQVHYVLGTNDKPRRVLEDEEDVNQKKVDVRVDEAVDSQEHEIVKQELNQAEGENQEKNIQEV